MKASSLLLLTLLSFLIDPAVSLCPGESYSEHKDVRFGLMTAADNRLRFVSVGCIPAIELAVDLINDNGSLLSGYRLTHNDPYIDTGVSYIKLLKITFYSSLIMFHNYHYDEKCIKTEINNITAFTITLSSYRASCTLGLCYYLSYSLFAVSAGRHYFILSCSHLV